MVSAAAPRVPRPRRLVAGSRELWAGLARATEGPLLPSPVREAPATQNRVLPRVWDAGRPLARGAPAAGERPALASALRDVALSDPPLQL